MAKIEEREIFDSSKFKTVVEKKDDKYSPAVMHDAKQAKQRQENEDGNRVDFRICVTGRKNAVVKVFRKMRELSLWSFFVY
mmetsp:Transcript_19018/g.25803  ORF Transcript_19018/g.25803 Transcript_19018/m.25803 type:complete len:81 (-) Transcript_19018:12-254(-)